MVPLLEGAACVRRQPNLDGSVLGLRISASWSTSAEPWWRAREGGGSRNEATNVHQTTKPSHLATVWTSTSALEIRGPAPEPSGMGMGDRERALEHQPAAVPRISFRLLQDDPIVAHIVWPQ